MSKLTMLRLLTSFLLVALASGSQSTINIPSSHFSNPSSRDVDCTPVDAPNKYPWQVAVLFETRPGGDIELMCGGTLIERNWVLTAAHCFPFNVTYFVLVGQTEITLPVNRNLLIPVERIVLHPDYVYPVKGFDIALARIDRCVELTEDIQLAKLPPLGYVTPDLTKCHVIGWGFEITEDAVSYVLEEGPLPVLDNEQCSQEDLWGDSVKHCQLCAGQNGTASCNDEGGEPLNCPGEDGSLEVHGILSFAPDLDFNDPTKPTVFTRVSCFVKWIELVLSSCFCCPQ